MDKQIVVHSHNGILLSNKKERTIGTHNMHKSQKLCWVKKAKQEYMLYDSIYREL